MPPLTATPRPRPDFKKHAEKQDFKISFKSANGNTIAFVNLSEHFIKAMTGKTKKTVTLEDVMAINDNDLLGFIMKAELVIESIAEETTISASEF